MPTQSPPVLPPDDFNETELFSAPYQITPPQPPPQPPVEPASPLAKYMRLPGLHVALPTRGAFLPPGSISLSAAGDVPVLPMRAIDELLLKSPDALISGHAIEKLLESCVPAIRTPRLISTPDLDVLLLAIRAATYGPTMVLNAACPKCSTENEFHSNLLGILGSAQPIDADNPVRLSDEVVAYVRPYNLQNGTQVALASFEETRKVQALEAADAGPAERNKMLNASLDRMARLNQYLLGECVVKVVVPGAEVTDRAQITAFVADIPKPWADAIEAKLREMNSKGIDKTVHVVCTECHHEWDTEVEFNPANFFDGGSSV